MKISLRSMRACCRQSIRTGFTLTEVVIAMGIAGVALPLALATMATTGQNHKVADAETRAAFASRSIRSQIVYVFGERPPSADALSPKNQTVYLGLNEYGQISAVVTADEFSLGRRGGDVRFLAKITYGKLADARVAELEMAQLTIQIDYPAQQPAQFRRKFTFTERIAYE